MDWEEKLKGTGEYDYDDWLEFFRRMPHTTVLAAKDELIDTLPSDGYAALMRWIEIILNPSKMDKLYKGRLDRENSDDIMEIAVGDNDELFYETLIKQNTLQLNSSGTSPQEVARLTANINIFRKELREIRSRKPKEGTALAKILAAAEKPPKKPRKTPVKRKSTAPKAVRATKKKKTSVGANKAKK